MFLLHHHLLFFSFFSCPSIYLNHHPEYHLRKHIRRIQRKPFSVHYGQWLQVSSIAEGIHRELEY